MALVWPIKDLTQTHPIFLFVFLQKLIHQKVGLFQLMDHSLAPIMLFEINVAFFDLVVIVFLQPQRI